ncbi:MAG: HAD family hydrolase [Nevskiales bacterium]
MIKCVLFDLDGTLVDTAPDLGFALNQVMLERGLEPLPAATIRPFASTGTRGLVKIGFGFGPEHADYPAIRDRFLSIYRANVARESKPFPGIPQLIAQLALRGLKWGVVTNKGREFTNRLIGSLDWPAPPAAIACADEVARGKPDPASLLLACERAGLIPAACVYVGDAARDMEAARRAGMPSIGVTYGYAELDSPPESWGADQLVNSPLEILSAVPDQRQRGVQHA